MNKAMIRYILGYVLSILALLLLLPCLVALTYQEMEGFHYLAVAAFGALLGYLMIRKSRGHCLSPQGGLHCHRFKLDCDELVRLPALLDQR